MTGIMPDLCGRGNAAAYAPQFLLTRRMCRIFCAALRSPGQEGNSMRHIIACLAADRRGAARAARIIAGLDRGALCRTAALFALIYIELVLFGVAMGGGQ
jgi:hypothetical protein